MRVKEIAAPALDVWENEPSPSDHPLLGFDNVLVSPHVAGSTRESRHNNHDDGGGAIAGRAGWEAAAATA